MVVSAILNGTRDPVLAATAIMLDVPLISNDTIFSVCPNWLRNPATDRLESLNEQRTNDRDEAL